MDAPQTQPPKKEKKGWKKVWKKIKGIFKDKSTSSTTPATAPITSTVAASATKPEADPRTKANDPLPASPKIEVDDTIEEPPSVSQPTADPPQPVEPSTSQQGEPNEHQMRFNKAQAIFAKYNLELSEADWDMRPNVPYERVSKNIRMRVKYTCHNCSTTFGHDRVCVGCQHRRCNKCSRYPAKKDKSKSSKRDQPEGPSATTTEAAGRIGQRTCHECQTGFELGTEECPNCHHKICERCLQEAVITVEQPPEGLAGQKPVGAPVTAGS